MDSRYLAGMLAIALVVTLGCGGGSGVERNTITGTVTYEGKPVPHGKIRFEPDREKGGSGPQGLAVITDGEYSTDDLAGKGVVSGPMKVAIEGYPSKEPMIPLMFPIYRDTIDVSPDNLVFDFSISKQPKQEEN
ncbi:MAG: hypothetical protein RH917_16515 [Lacipirellulaceae bacterium]